MDSIDRRSFIGRLAAGTSALAAGGLAAAPGAAPASLATIGSAGSAAPSEPAFRPLPLGSVRPRGWLERQLRIQADGLSGHLDEFWPDVAQSEWFGGDAEGWERAPYWLDGVIPLAWTLDDPALKAKVSGYMEEIFRRQRPDGWYGPYPEDAATERYDLWAILLANKVVAQYHDATGDERALRAVEASLAALAPELERTPLYDWGRFRWFEGLIPIFHLHDRTGDPGLLALAARLREQGFDYGAWYERDDVRLPTPRRGLWNWEKHVVNTAMALKAGALSWRLDQRPGARQEPARMLQILDRYHGQVTGMFTGDECLSGKNPVQGTELCSVVEAMYSLEVLLSTLGDPGWGDRLEQVAYNALPATFTPNMWAHQYDQQVNQVQCTHNPDHMWSTNGPESNIYGLEPNYGCCTSNMHQGWPKLAGHLWMRTPDGGIAAVAWAPSEARFEAGGVPVTVSVDTEYPFRETLAVTVRPDAPARFPLLLRVPGWAEGATVRVEDGPARSMEAGTFHRLEREWRRGPTRLELVFPMAPRVTERYNRAVTLERGPLVYALSLPERWTRINADEPYRELPHGDFEVRPAGPWNYGVLLDPAGPARGVEFRERPVGEQPFSPDGVGVEARVRGRRLPRWEMRHGWAGETPRGVQRSDEPLEELTLIPYGATNIRVTELPRLAE